jgi:hypothetical protein
MLHFLMKLPLMLPSLVQTRLLQRLTVGALTALLVACSGMQVAPPPPGAISTPADSYAAVIDAGSSGSRIYLYQVSPDGTFVAINKLFSNKDAAHGLSYYNGSNGLGAGPTDAGPAGIEPLLAALGSYINRQGIGKSQFRVNVLATAGMRLLDATTASAIYDSVRNTITQNGYRTGQIGTITGQSEGLYSWADVNFLNGNFKALRVPQGIVEVGGASSQVAFVTANRHGDNVVIRTINGVEYPVFSVSYLGLGQTEARRAMLASSTSGGLQASVCYPNNSTGTPSAFDPDIGGALVSAAGASFGSACYAEYQKVVTSISANSVNNYPVAQISRLPGFSSTQFVGVSSIYNVLKSWGALGTANPQRALEDALSSQCSGANAWPKVLNQYKNAVTVFSQSACANGAYLNTYVFGKESLNIQPSQLSSMDAVNGKDLTWTRGFVLLGASK